MRTEVVVHTTLVRIGNSEGIIIPRAILKILGLKSKAKLTLATDGTSLVISPAQDQDHETRVAAAVKEGLRRYKPMLLALADR